MCLHNVQRACLVSAALLVVTGCGGQAARAADPCQQAEVHLRECFGAEAGPVVADCDAEQAQRVVEMSCTELQTLRAAGKADGSLGPLCDWVAAFLCDLEAADPAPSDCPVEPTMLGSYEGDGGGQVFGTISVRHPATGEIRPVGAGVTIAFVNRTEYYVARTDSAGYYSATLPLTAHMVTIWFGGGCPQELVQPASQPTNYDWLITLTADGMALVRQ